MGNSCSTGPWASFQGVPGWWDSREEPQRLPRALRLQPAQRTLCRSAARIALGMGVEITATSVGALRGDLVSQGPQY